MIDEALFRDPPAAYRPVAMWFLNGRLDPDQVRRQIAAMAEGAVGGIQVAARTGLETPYLSEAWFTLVELILQEASKRSRLYYTEVLIGFYGWEPCLRIERKPDGDMISPGSQYFSRKEIGPKRYAAMVSLSKACRRLAERGLARALQGTYAKWSGVEITASGRLWLSANKSNIMRQS